MYRRWLGLMHVMMKQFDDQTAVLFRSVAGTVADYLHEQNSAAEELEYRQLAEAAAEAAGSGG